MAPKILQVSEAAPNWKIIVEVRPVCDLIAHAPAIKIAVERILAVMKVNEFVHGDFRATNVLGVLQQGEFQGQVVVSM
jgi:hypothetical protein